MTPKPRRESRLVNPLFLAAVFCATFEEISGTHPLDPHWKLELGGFTITPVALVLERGR